MADSTDRNRLLSPAERTLHSVLAAWLLREVRLSLSVPCVQEGAPRHDDPVCLEIVCASLSRIGLLRLEAERWRVVEPHAEPDGLAKTARRADLDTLLEALVCHAPDVEDLRAMGAIVATSDPMLTGVCEALAACGYMECLPQKATWRQKLRRTPRKPAWRWTAGFHPWLVARGGLELTRIAPASGDAVGAALLKIPAGDRRVLAGRTCAVHSHFARYFLKHWDNGRWRNWQEVLRDQDCYVPGDHWDMALAAGLYRRLHG
ncbi:hypothetical protein [Pseudoruegeria sp. HB172150]|uniref:hypothetical protein n=1 Tax=Pseudoruegeria sp. HB172150 TaxID=2721164 RepID=UPI001555D275|nr:hypothetical protein [Pseudoruegeria sp. HB172150]